MEAHQHLWHKWSWLLNGLPHRLTTPWPSLGTTRAYNAVAVSRDRTGLQRRGRLSRPRRLTTRRQLARPHRLTTPRPVHLFVPPQMLRSSLPSASCGLVYINTSGRTCLHELFIEYEKVTTWEARFSSNKLEENYHYSSSTLDGSIDMRRSRCHYGLLNFKQPVGRSHWPSC